MNKSNIKFDLCQEGIVKNLDDLPKDVKNLVETIGITPPGKYYIDPHRGTEYLGSFSKRLVDHAKCPFSTEFTISDVIRISQKNKNRRTNPEIRYPELTLEAKYGDIQDKTLIESAKILDKTRPIVMIENDEDEKYFFKGEVRGTEVYAERTRERVRELADTLESIKGTSIFFTVTVKHKEFMNNILQAWKSINERKEKFVRKAKKLGDFHFIEVTEAHLDGFPHVHVLCKFQNRFFAHFVDKKGRWRMKDETFRKKLKACWGEDISDVQVVRQKALAGYICKYMSKGVDIKTSELSGGEVILSEDERKNMLGTLLPIIAQRRMWSASLGLRKMAKTQRTQRFEKIAEQRIKLHLGNTEKERLDHALLKLLNNSTKKCLRKIVLLSGKEEKWRKFAENGTILKGNTEFDEQITQEGLELGCCRCGFAYIMQDYFKRYGLTGTRCTDPPEYWKEFLQKKGLLII